MKRARLLVMTAALALASVCMLHAQEAAPRLTPTIQPDLSNLSIGTLLDQMQTVRVGKSNDVSPAEVVIQFLQLQPDQAQTFIQLLQARQATVNPLLKAIQQKAQQLQSLLQSGGNAGQVGAVVIQIYGLQQQVAQAQQMFLAKFVGLLDHDQQERLDAVRIAAQLQPVLPAFEALSLF